MTGIVAGDVEITCKDFCTPLSVGRPILINGMKYICVKETEQLSDPMKPELVWLNEGFFKKDHIFFFEKVNDNETER